MTSKELSVRSMGGRRTLNIESARTAEYMEAYRHGEFDAIQINPSRGYVADDIEFIASYPFVRDVHVVFGASKRWSLEPLKAIRSLRSLSIYDRVPEIRLADVPGIDVFCLPWAATSTYFSERVVQELTPQGSKASKSDESPTSV